MPKKKHITYLNAFSHLVKFSCVIFHLFSLVVQVLYHATHCSGHNIYVFGSILDCFVQFFNLLALLVNYPNNARTVNIPFCRNLTNFCLVNRQPIYFVKTCNDFILPFVKGLNWNICVCKNGNYYVIEGMMGWILLLTWRFILDNSKKWSMKYHNSSSKNTLKLFLCVMCVL